MAIPKAVHVDFLDVSTLRGPLLDSYYGSAIQKEDVGVIAREIMRRYLAKVPRDTGNLAFTAKVTYHRAKGHTDKRWESEFSVGGPRAPYVVPLEDEKHYLSDVLREMGFNVGDRVDGPQGRVAKEHRQPPAPARTAVAHILDDAAIIEDPRDTSLRESANTVARSKATSAAGAAKYYALQAEAAQYRQETGQAHTEAEGAMLGFRERRRARGLSPQPDRPRGPNTISQDPNRRLSDTQNPNVPPRRG